MMSPYEALTLLKPPRKKHLKLHWRTHNLKVPQLHVKNLCPGEATGSFSPELRNGDDRKELLVLFNSSYNQFFLINYCR